MRFLRKSRKRHLLIVVRSDPFVFRKLLEEWTRTVSSDPVFLQLFIFESGASLKTIVGDGILHVALEHIGFADMSRLFEIEVNEDGVDLDFPGWVSVGDNDSTVVLVRANRWITCYF
jgi:hypothetical protein